MGKPLIFNIQKYSIHDGAGIRTTVFFKGCPLSCSWCHNPESQCFEQELLFHADRCRGCGACEAVCGQNAIAVKIQDPNNPIAALDRSLCGTCGACVAVCPYNARETVGTAYELPDLIRELEKDRMFYERSGGGITLSGGEPLCQDMDYIEALVRQLHQKGYSVNIDTCGYVPYAHIRQVLPFTDSFLYDIKLLDSQAHRKYTGVDNRMILENLIALSADGGNIHLRLPLIEGVNATQEHLDAVIHFLQDHKINVHRIHLLKYHSTGSGKYARLDRLYDKDSMAPPEDAWLEQAVERFRERGFQNIQIGG